MIKEFFIWCFSSLWRSGCISGFTLFNVLSIDLLFSKRMTLLINKRLEEWLRQFILFVFGQKQRIIKKFLSHCLLSAFLFFSLFQTFSTINLCSLLIQISNLVYKFIKRSWGMGCWIAIFNSFFWFIWSSGFLLKSMVGFWRVLRNLITVWEYCNFGYSIKVLIFNLAHVFIKIFSWLKINKLSKEFVFCFLKKFVL